MARLVAVMGQDLEFLVEWERGTGVASAELAATWCALEIRLDSQPVTLVEDGRGGGLRRAVHTSAYPLAEWIATHWWSLTDHLRPSATPTRDRSWRSAGAAPWLRSHNLRAAGDGMPWPDLTIVPEGPLTRLTWSRGPGVASQPVTFLTAGDALLPVAAVREAMVRFVEQVLDRLSEAGVKKTLLQDEWSALAALTNDERSFAHAAARLGLDPFDVGDELTDQLQPIERELGPELFDEFLNSADPDELRSAAKWIEQARNSMRLIAGPGLDPTNADPVPGSAPWVRGYSVAQHCRAQLGLPATSSIDLAALVGLVRLPGSPAGIKGVVEVSGGRLGLVLPETVKNQTGSRFAQARALGLSMLTTRSLALLDPTHTELAQQTRAFAAEVLAPAEGIAELLSVFPHVTGGALEAVADRFDTSPLLVQLQYENQLASS